MNELMNHSRLYWYMWSIWIKSLKQKKRVEACVATVMYTFRASSISFSVCSARACFNWISFATAFDSERTRRAVSFSKRAPLFSEITARISSSISLSRRLLSALCIKRRFFCSSKSGFSFATTIPSSCCSRPSKVIMKLRRVTLVNVSGR